MTALIRLAAALALLMSVIRELADYYGTHLPMPIGGHESTQVGLAFAVCLLLYELAEMFRR